MFLLTFEWNYCQLALHRFLFAFAAFLGNQVQESQGSLNPKTVINEKFSFVWYFIFLAVREVIYRQVRFEFQIIVENGDGKDSLSEFIPLQIISLCHARTAWPLMAKAAAAILPILGTLLSSKLSHLMNLLTFPLHTSQKNSLNISPF